MTSSKSLPVIPAEVRSHDNTMMSDWAYCQRKYALAHILKKKKREIAFPLSFGKLLHHGLDVFYKTMRDNEAEKSNRDWEQSIGISLESMYEVNYIDPIDGHRTKARALKVMADYAIHYKDDPDFTNILFTESPFDIQQADGYKWGGIIDLWAEYHHRAWIVDHKSTSIFGQYYFDDFKRSPQFLGYLNAGGDLHGLSPAGVLLNVLAVRKTNHEFARRPLIYADYLLDEAKRMQVNHYHEIDGAIGRFEEALGSGASDEDVTNAVFNTSNFNPNLYNCVGKYGRCPFYDLCEAQPQNRARVINIEYEDHTWDWTNIED